MGFIQPSIPFTYTLETINKSMLLWEGDGEMNAPAMRMKKTYHFSEKDHVISENNVCLENLESVDPTQ